MVKVTGRAISLHQRRFKSQVLQRPVQTKNEIRNLRDSRGLAQGFAEHLEKRIGTKITEQIGNQPVGAVRNTSISLKMSRGPIISESYLTCALLVAKATEAYIIPFSFMRLDSIL